LLHLLLFLVVLQLSAFSDGLLLQLSAFPIVAAASDMPGCFLQLPVSG
jgi:hypothetical protein